MWRPRLNLGGDYIELKLRAQYCLHLFRSAAYRQYISTGYSYLTR